MRRFLSWLKVSLLPLDLLMIGLALVIGYALRSPAGTDGLYLFAQGGLALSLGSYLRLYVISWPIWIAVFADRGLYDLRARRGLLDELGRVVLAVTTGAVFTLSLLFLTKTSDVSRLVVFHTYWLAIVLVFLGRLFSRFIEQLCWARGVATVRVAFLGHQKTAHDLKMALKRTNEGPWRYAGVIGDGRKECLGTVEDIPELIRQHKLEELWLLEADRTEKSVSRAVNYALTSGATVRILPQRSELIQQELVPEEVLGLPLLRVRRTPLEGWGRVIKRLTDVLVAIPLLIVLSPVFLLIWLLIQLDTPGPTIFRQRRVGEQGQEFWFYKFRSMVVDAEKQHAALMKKHGNMFKLKDDPRQTKVGRWLRRTSLDELPQLWNVVLGDMSLVGPRPPLPIEVESYSPLERRRLGVKPGMTGLWQVSGRSNVSFADWVELDAYYIEHWSFWLDLSILYRTLLVVLIGRGAY